MVDLVRWYTLPELFHVEQTEWMCSEVRSTYRWPGCVVWVQLAAWSRSRVAALPLDLLCKMPERAMYWRTLRH